MVELLRVAGVGQRGQQQRPERHDGHARRPREGREERAGHEADQREAARQRAENALHHIHQPFGGLCFRQHVSRIGEQRKRHQQRGVDDAVDLDGHDRQINVCREKPEHRAAKENGKQWRTGNRGSEQHDDERPHHDGLNALMRYLSPITAEPSGITSSQIHAGTPAKAMIPS